MRTTRWFTTGLAAAAMIGAAAPAQAAPATDGRVGPALSITGNGRHLRPAGHMVTVGNFPMAGALTPDGRFYWAVDAGHGHNDVRIVDVATRRVIQTLPLPGAGWGIAIAPDGRRAYVPGIAKGTDIPTGPTKGDDGDVVHVFGVDPASGRATEQDPIALPQTGPGQAQQNSLPPVTADFPTGTAVSPDGRTLAVVLSQADRVALIDTSTRHVRTATVGAYPAGVAIKDGAAYVSNEYDGTLTVIDLASGAKRATIAGLGGERGDRNSHPVSVLADPARKRVYVAVANRDLVALVDTAAGRVERRISVARGTLGTQPTALALSPDGATLYSADSNEDAVAAIALTDHTVPGTPGSPAEQPRTVRRHRSVTKIRRYRTRARRENRYLKRHHSQRARAKRRARHRRTLARLRRTLLYGARVPACAGPTSAQDRTYRRAILRALARRDKGRRRAHRIGRPRTGDTAAQRRARRRAAKRARTRADRRAKRAFARARAKLPAIRACAPGTAGAPGRTTAKAFTVIGKIPTAAYPTDVEVTSDGRTLLWTAGKGLGAGPNPGYKFAGAKKEYTTPTTPYGTYVPDMLLGRVGLLAPPTDDQLPQLTRDADAQVVPANAQNRPPGNPVPAPGSGPSSQIRHVFYIVRENRTYDQVFGRDPRGDGDPSLELFGDNVPGTPDATQGITPNAHALSRAFPLLDHLYANSEVSVDGHLITAGSIATDYVQKATQANYAGRGRAFDFGIYPVTFGPNEFVFDQAARQDVSFFNYGEQAAGSTPMGDDGRPTYDTVFANTDQTTYAGNLFIGCQSPPQPPTNCTQDSQTTVPTGTQSRVAAFRQRFAAQLAAGDVPRLNYLILPNDHTNGTTPNGYSPQALIADNDLALGQLVDTISHSSIWPDTAIFVVEDDSQDGADHVDAHRMPALVISPWARQGVVPTRYDQYSVLRTIGLLLGLKPLSLNDELATPMYDAFQTTRRSVTYTAVTPQQSLTETNPPDAPMGGISSRLPYSHLDLVPQALSDEILWRSAHGRGSTPPAPGPNASREEHERAVGVMRVLRRGGDARVWLARHAEEEDER